MFVTYITNVFPANFTTYRRRTCTKRTGRQTRSAESDSLVWTVAHVQAVRKLASVSSKRRVDVECCEDGMLLNDVVTGVAICMKNTVMRNVVACCHVSHNINRLTPKDPCSGRTALLTSKRCILYNYSTNTGTEYFKHCKFSPFFSSNCSLFHNFNVFGSCIIHILYTECPKILKSNSGVKMLTLWRLTTPIVVVPHR